MDEPHRTAHPDTHLVEAIRDWFAHDPSRMTMMAARKFAVPEREVVEALADAWPIDRLRPDAFREMMEGMTQLGPMRVFVRSRAAVIESVGVFGGYTETGPFFNVQTDTLDMHILLAEIGALYAVRKRGHDSDFRTHSFQVFDHAGDAAFKAFLWDQFPAVPPERIVAFDDLARRLKQG